MIPQIARVALADARGLRTTGIDAVRASGSRKKVLIADTLAALRRPYLRDSSRPALGTGAWLGVLAYTFQIYFDFSGYSDMAIGLGCMFGFRFLENFDSPVRSRSSITEFWRRWHISLSTWLRDYLYIPLGGNRGGAFAHLPSISCVMMLPRRPLARRELDVRRLGRAARPSTC